MQPRPPAQNIPSELDTIGSLLMKPTDMHLHLGGRFDSDAQPKVRTNMVAEKVKSQTTVWFLVEHLQFELGSILRNLQ